LRRFIHIRANIILDLFFCANGVLKSEDGSTAGTIFERWGEVSLQAGDAFGKTLRIIDQAKEVMIAAGFVVVAERRFKLPIGAVGQGPAIERTGLV
jgi:hypothetical protein